MSLLGDVLLTCFIHGKRCRPCPTEERGHLELRKSKCPAQGHTAGRYRAGMGASLFDAKAWSLQGSSKTSHLSDRHISIDSAWPWNEWGVIRVDFSPEHAFLIPMIRAASLGAWRTDREREAAKDSQGSTRVHRWPARRACHKALAFLLLRTCLQCQDLLSSFTRHAHSNACSLCGGLLWKLCH